MLLLEARDNNVTLKSAFTTPSQQGQDSPGNGLEGDINYLEGRNLSHKGSRTRDITPDHLGHSIRDIGVSQGNRKSQPARVPMTVIRTLKEGSDGVTKFPPTGRDCDLQAGSSDRPEL
jgi:hypothetical protein